jgi:hypothetical protein
VFDIIGLLVQVWRFDRTDAVYSDISLLAVANILLFLDLYYLGWVAHLQLRLPQSSSKHISAAMLGFTAKLQG